MQSTAINEFGTAILVGWSITALQLLLVLVFPEFFASFQGF